MGKFWSHAVYLFVIAGFIVALGLTLSRGSDLGDDLERAEAGIRSAREAQRIATAERDIAREETERAIAEVGAVTVDLENSRRHVADLYRIAKESRDSTEAIGRSLDRVGELFEEGDRYNEKGKAADGPDSR